MHILMVGTGYVGLVTASCFSEMGHHVICLDIDANKIEQLTQGKLPFFEPGLKELVDRNVEAGRLSFTTSYEEGVSQASVCFIAVPTPSREDGSCDLSYVLAAARMLAQTMGEIAKRHCPEKSMILRPFASDSHAVTSHSMRPTPSGLGEENGRTWPQKGDFNGQTSFAIPPLDGYRLIVTKSTVPVGTADRIREIIASTLAERQCDVSFDIVSNPEFLKEGSAVQDCMKPDRVILGVESPCALDLMRQIYSAFTLNHDRILTMDIRSAEMTKYAANAMLATRISFMNELATLCEQVGAQINHVRIGIGSDVRIGYQFLYAGLGFGGSCFPKDIRALQATAQAAGIAMPILEAVDTINQRQRILFMNKVISHYASQGGLKGKTLAVWGLSFKPDTDDMRDAPSLCIIRSLLQEGAVVHLYDPIAIPVAKQILPPSAQIVYCKDEYESAEKADGIILVTEWKQFRFVNFDTLCTKLNQRVLFDGRNQYKPQEMHAKGFHYYGVGCGDTRRPSGSSQCGAGEASLGANRGTADEQSLHDAISTVQNTCNQMEGSLAH